VVPNSMYGETMYMREIYEEIKRIREVLAVHAYGQIQLTKEVACAVDQEEFVRRMMKVENSLLSLAFPEEIIEEIEYDL
jgi:negative regulator of replication initiation